MNTYEFCSKNSGHSFETARNFVEKYFDGDLERGLFLLARFTESQIDYSQFPDAAIGDVDPADFQEFCDAHNF
jgi:hypothetical protein